MKFNYLPKDKGTHYVYTQVLCLCFYAAFLVVFPQYAIVCALAAVTVVAIGFEVYQGKTHTGKKDYKDAMWGILGATASFGSLWIYNALN